MNTYIVYHHMPVYGRFIDSDEVDAATISWPDNYMAVASVQADSLRDVYRLTQHRATHGWPENAGVTKLVARVRSTAVGDVIRLKTTCDDNLSVVASVGFVPLKTESPQTD